MTQMEMENLIIDAVRQIQSVSGRPEVEITSNTRPVLDLPEFDSLNGVEATVEIFDRLKIDLDLNNVLVDDSKALTIAEAASRLLQYMPK